MISKIRHFFSQKNSCNVLLIGVGIKIIISVSKIKKIIETRKNRKENIIRDSLPINYLYIYRYTFIECIKECILLYILIYLMALVFGAILIKHHWNPVIKFKKELFVLSPSLSLLLTQNLYSS